MSTPNEVSVTPTMYWRQATVGVAVGLAGGYVIYTRGAVLGTALAVAVSLYIGTRWILATIGRTRYWRHRHGPRRTCTTCGQTIRRQPGDWIRTCYRCDSQAGWLGLRLLTHSVPSTQFRRTVLGPQLLVLVTVGVLVISGAAGGYTVDDLPNPQRYIDNSGGVEPPTAAGSDTDSTADETVSAQTSEESPPTTVETVPVGDRDGDRLNDRLEGEPPVSNSSVGHKDIYLRVVIGGGVNTLPPRWLQTVQTIFSEMPISNPDGSTGITMHIIEVVKMDSTLTVTGDQDSIRIAMDQIPAYSGPMQCGDFHTVILTSWSSSEVAGRGSAPGVASVVDTTYPNVQDRRSVLTQSIVHELLHNIVGGRLDTDHPKVKSRYHTTTGWLTGEPDVVSSDRFLSAPVQQLLSAEGFASLDNFWLQCT